MDRLRIKQGLPPLEGVRTPPALQEHLKPVLLAFNALGSCRPSAFSGLAPIPWTAINAWCERYGYTHEEQERYVIFINALDAVYIKHYAKD